MYLFLKKYELHRTLIARRTGTARQQNSEVLNDELVHRARSGIVFGASLGAGKVLGPRRIYKLGDRSGRNGGANRVDTALMPCLK